MRSAVVAGRCEAQVGDAAVGQTAGVVEQLPQGNLLRRAGIRQGEVREVAADGRVEVELACLHQLHDGGGGKGLAQGGDVELRLRRHRLAPAGRCRSPGGRSPGRPG